MCLNKSPRECITEFCFHRDREMTEALEGETFGKFPGELIFNSPKT
jgi:hypothetical protein